jgi:hypothetical protein
MLMTRLICFFLVLLAASPVSAQRKETARELYALRIYHFSSLEQEKRILTYLESALVPAIKRQGLNNIGVFETLGADTAKTKRIYLLIPYTSAQQLAEAERKIVNDKSYIAEAADYIEASYDKPVYDRLEIIHLQAFALAPKVQVPALNSAKSERIYELRSYESPSEKIYRNKVQMFNESGEIALFKRLNFNAVFYGEVLAGSRMPNLMYMTSFENMDDRNAHWKTFSDDAEWKTLSTKPEYQHNVSHIDIWFLRALDFSDL